MANEYLNNPLFHMGIGILGNQGRVGPGLQTGLGTLMQQRQFMGQQAQQQQQLELQRQRMAMLQGQQAAEQEAAQRRQQAIQQLTGQNPEMARIAQAYPEVAKKMLMQQYAPDPMKPTSLQQNLQAAGFQPGSPEYRKALMAAITKPTTSINMGNSVPEYNKLPAGYVYKRDPSGNIIIDDQGVPTAVPIKGGPAAQEANKKQGALSRVTNNLKQAEGYLNELNNMGAIVNVENNSMDNIAASIASSGLGQSVANTLGTKAQSARNMLNQLRPLLMNDIRQASEMGAKGLDSEKELEFYLQAVSDPTRDVQFNMAALKVLNDAYGLGNVSFKIDKNVMNRLKKEASSYKGMATPQGSGQNTINWEDM